MFTLTIHQPVHGPQGQTYKVEAQLEHGPLSAWYWTQQEALEARDRLCDAGIRNRVYGLPAVVAGG